jgi:hypothetical protein
MLKKMDPWKIAKDFAINLGFAGVVYFMTRQVVRELMKRYNPMDNYDESKDEELIATRNTLVSSTTDRFGMFQAKNLCRCPTHEAFVWKKFHDKIDLLNGTKGKIIFWQDNDKKKAYASLVRPDGKILSDYHKDGIYIEGKLGAKIIDGYLVGVDKYGFWFAGKGKYPIYKFED